MAAISLATAQAHLDQWMAADLAVSSGQAYSIQGRSFTKVNADEITKKITYWSNMVNRLSNARGARVRFGVPAR